jgi:hypothetical protein
VTRKIKRKAARAATKTRPKYKAPKSTASEDRVILRNSNNPQPAVIPDGYRKIDPQDVLPLGFERDPDTGVLYMVAFIDGFTNGPDGKPVRTCVLVEEPAQGPQPVNIGQLLVILAQRAHNCGGFVLESGPDPEREAVIMEAMLGNSVP